MDVHCIETVLYLHTVFLRLFSFYSHAELPLEILLRLCEICWYAGLGPARPGLRALLSTIYEGFGFYVRRREEPPRCPVLFWRVRWVERPLGEFGVDLSLFANQPLSQPQLKWNVCHTFNLQCLYYRNFFRQFLDIRERVHLYCQVLWFGVSFFSFFYTLDLNLTRLSSISL